MSTRYGQYVGVYLVLLFKLVIITSPKKITEYDTSNSGYNINIVKRAAIHAASNDGLEISPKTVHGAISRRRSVGTVVQLSPGEAEEAVAKHNELRRQENGSNVEYMTWNSELARMAQDYAQKCQWWHSSLDASNYTTGYRIVGENLFYTTGRTNLSQVVLKWFSEKREYNYSSAWCMGHMCGHYTQVVWAYSKEVGCGKAFCVNLNRNDDKTTRNAKYTACNYGPRGNYRGVRPYRKGQACSHCKSGRHWCKTGLCYDGCSSGGTGCGCPDVCSNGGIMNLTNCMCVCAPGWMGLDCSESCADLDSGCGTSSALVRSDCHLQPIKEKCPLMCDICGMCSQTVCEGGGTRVPEELGCKCNCTDDREGEHCQFDKSQKDFGAVLTFRGDIRKWTTAWKIFQDAVPRSVNEYCRANVKICCGEEATSMRIDGTFLNESRLLTGSGYPFTLDGSDTIFSIMILAKTTSNNSLCVYDKVNENPDMYISYPILYNGMMYQKSALVNALTDCCNFTLQEASTQPLPVKSPNEGLADWQIVLVVLAAAVVISLTLGGVLFYTRRRETYVYDETDNTQKMQKVNHNKKEPTKYKTTSLHKNEIKSSR